MRSLCLALIVLAIAGDAISQTQPVEGLRDNTPKIHALINAKIVQGPGRVIEHGTVLLRDGTIEAVGANIAPPADARIWDYEGLTIYPGLIEMYSHLGLGGDDKKETEAAEEDYRASYWNENVTPERDVLAAFDPKEADLEALRSLGFTCALIVPDKGILGGSSALVNLGDDGANEREIVAHVAQSVDLVYTRGRGREGYPTSLMGRIALVRQAILDAQWYAAAQAAYQANPAQERPEANAALAALAGDLEAGRPVLCAVENDLNLMRAQKIAAEFNLDLWIRASGFEYRIADRLARAKARLIVPVDYPKKPEVDSPELALETRLDVLQHWEAAPANASALEAAGLDFALTTDGLKDVKEFRTRVAEAIERGLTFDGALAAVTTVPAGMLGLDQVLGTIDRGKAAHLAVVDGELFAKDAKVVDVWVDGRPYEVNKRPEVDPRGTWGLDLQAPLLAGRDLELEISGEIDKLKGTLRQDSTEVKLNKVGLDRRRLTLMFPGEELDVDGVVRLTASVSTGALTGQGVMPDGSWFKWSATPAAAQKDEKKDDGKGEEKPEAGEREELHSFGAFALYAPPEQPKQLLVRNATIWTSGPQGRLENADMLISNGRVSKIGRDLKAPSGAEVIEATGKHVTPGLIDCHSHSAAQGSVNEAGQAVTAEVRIADVLNPRDIALYRELAGGLTVANILHGSANPIGGQNAVIKLRFCGSPDELLIEGAKPGIKFALGENVKQSNWGDQYTTRYPQTRMGVEQIIRDRFDAALAYEADWKAYESKRNKKGVIPPRRDLELEALLEVLHGDRIIHCHSYRQDEILMLVRVAEDYGFRVGVFQHVLEGYKVAEAIAAHGAGASTFSDWWAYKFEVYDAIPYNGALMHDAGVLVSFNSDSDELARRMNLEAAKAVHYGGVPESEALKFVTLNPAKQLRIDDRVGSLEVGKDGDFVVWSGNPLSTYSRCEQTWIEGRKYFDIERDREMNEAIASERARLVQKVLAPGNDKKESKHEGSSTHTGGGGL